MDSGGDYLLWNRGQAGDVSGVSRGVLSDCGGVRERRVERVVDLPSGGEKFWFVANADFGTRGFSRGAAADFDRVADRAGDCVAGGCGGRDDRGGFGAGISGDRFAKFGEAVRFGGGGDAADRIDWARAGFGVPASREDPIGAVGVQSMSLKSKIALFAVGWLVLISGAHAYLNVNWGAVLN